MYDFIGKDKQPLFQRYLLKITTGKGLYQVMQVYNGKIAKIKENERLKAQFGSKMNSEITLVH